MIAQAVDSGVKEKERRIRRAVSAMEEIQTSYRRGLDLSLGVDPLLASTLHHVLHHPGNLVRASLVFHLASNYGVAREAARDLAVAVEYFHSASLVFDDLPCMDDATERRGVPCAHVQFGEANAILAALALINRSYALLWKVLAALPQDRRETAAALVEKCLGQAGVINGQCRDLNFEFYERTARHVLTVAMGKTVHLILLAFLLPAVVAGASRRDQLQWRRLAVYWGLSYQILDDLKDIHATAETTGKTTDRDAGLHRPNLGLVEGSFRAMHRLRRLMVLGDETLSALALPEEKEWFLRELRDRLANETNAYLQRWQRDLIS